MACLGRGARCSSGHLFAGQAHAPHANSESDTSKASHDAADNDPASVHAQSVHNSAGDDGEDECGEGEGNVPAAIHQRRADQVTVLLVDSGEVDDDGRVDQSAGERDTRSA